MSRYEVIEAKPYHCGQMARRMRGTQRSAVLTAGLHPHRELRARYRESSICRAWLVDGELAGLGGMIGGLLSDSGFVWLALDNGSVRHRVAIVREAKGQLAELLRTKDELRTTIALDDAPALRLAAFLGFHVGHDGPGQPAHCRGERARLIAEVVGNPALRVTVGASDYVVMGYH